MSLTPAQQQAIAARGNVLVIAGAGTGKTSTLVERCLNCLLHETPPASLDEILMVTFTDAAAAEMRQRIRVRLEQELATHPQALRWQEQLALFETAHIGTLHRFCLQLVRQHFYELGLDPQLSVLAEEEARLLADETLDELLKSHYSGRSAAAEAVQDLIQAQGRGWDKPIRALVLRLHHYTQTRPDPAGWFDDQLAMFGKSDPILWRCWLEDGIAEWRGRWLHVLENIAGDNEIARTCSAALGHLTPGHPASRSQAAASLEAVIAACAACPRGKKGAWLDPLKDFLGQAEFLFSLARTSPGVDPLTEDWNWVRSQMITLLGLAREFEAAFTDAKRELGMVDFHDLEQHALRLLWDAQANQPTRTALQWRKKLRFVFVDEYQDINAAQDKIIEALSRDDKQANRFLVGDVKQSIYRFRLANPRIFQSYAEAWRNGKGNGQAIPLVENFRSREGILNFINSLFSNVMRRELGGVAYDGETQLRFGAPEEREALSSHADSSPCVELHLRIRNGNSLQEQDEESSQAAVLIGDLEEADKEARLVAMKLREMWSRKHSVWDEKTKSARPVEWRDMAVLLRSPANKSESYAKEFSRLSVPLLVARGGFYQSVEISDLLSLLQLLDNPLQDLPLLAVLHSPLVGLTLDELATIRLIAKGTIWSALLRWQETGGQKPKSQSPGSRPQARPASPSETQAKVASFLDRYAHWRRLVRQVSLSRGLEAVLSETHFASWLLTQPRGEQRHANVQRFLGLAQQFDQFQRQGLFRFLRFIEAQKLAETEPEVAAVSEENSVRLMSIHQSKGLEFPVVVVADLGKPFNTSDLRSDVILDETYGLCPQIKPPHTGKSYPSLPHWLARQRQHEEMLGEELRLLYVAVTRARHTLILSGAVSDSKFQALWNHRGELDPAVVLSARSYSDWLGYWFSRNHGMGVPGAVEGENSWLRWFIHNDAVLLGPQAAPTPVEPPPNVASSTPPEVWQKLQQRLAWQYPFAGATRMPAKTSVSVLRRTAIGSVDEIASPLQFQKPGFGPRISTALASSKTSAADIGNAHHTFLQLVSLERLGNVSELRAEAQRMVKESALPEEQVNLLDFRNLLAFWQSDLGKRVRAQAEYVRRELAFTARFSLAEIAELKGESLEPYLEHEFVVVQGVADLAVLLPKEIWLIDFKTDAVEPKQLAEKMTLYEPQLNLYARALSRIHKRPVSACWLYFLAARTAMTVNVPPE